jgi:hypothetical protein
MEKNEPDGRQTDDMIRNAMNAPEPDDAQMNFPWLEEARKKVRQRQAANAEESDIYTLIAGFLNLKIRLYHAIAAAVVILVVTIYARKEKPVDDEQLLRIENSASLTAAKNSTVLSSISTFVLPR